MSERSIGRRDAIRITAVAGISAAFAGTIGLDLLGRLGLHRLSETRSRMGTVVTLTMIHPDPAEGRAMIGAAFAEMDRLEAILSRHRASTAVGRLNATGHIDAPPTELLDVLGQARSCAEASVGAFDVTILPLLTLYERSFAAGGPPAEAEIEATRALVDHRALDFDADRAMLAGPGMAITLDGVAKGYIVDRTVELLAARGSERVLVDAGGDMASAGRGVRRDPWTVAIQDPHRERDLAGFVRLGGESIATSGDYMRSFTQDRRYNHIIDPRTGRSPERVSSVSVVAPTAMQADALSTAAMVLGPTDGLALLERTPDVEGMIIDKDGARTATRGMVRRSV